MPPLRKINVPIKDAEKEKQTFFFRWFGTHTHNRETSTIIHMDTCSNLYIHIYIERVIRRKSVQRIQPLQWVGCIWCILKGAQQLSN